MQNARAGIIEKIVERLASVALAASCACAVWVVLGRSGFPLHVAAPCATAALVYYICLGCLARIDAGTAFVVPRFEAPELPEPAERHELLLTDADRVPTSVAPTGEEPLLLDDMLAELEPNSRVVRLFDAARMPTPGQLDCRIRQHLSGPRAAVEHPDASQALYDALAELRRSLR
jgi:hypothetical protein